MSTTNGSAEAATAHHPRRKATPFLPAKRLLAVDPGSHSLKLMLAEEVFGRFRVLRHEILELHGEGLVSEEEVLGMVRSLVREFGDHPIALALPHYLALSQVVNLASTDPEDVRESIEEQAVKLSGLSESHMVYDYAPLEPFGRYENPFWITLCQEEEIQRQIDRCDLADLDLCEATTTANALISAYQAVHPEADRAVLVDIGGAGTTVAVLWEGQGVLATTFPLGGDTLTDALAAARECPYDEAENLKRSLNLTESSAQGLLSTPLQSWYSELQHVLKEWASEHRRSDISLESMSYILCGGGSNLGGLVDYLNRLGEFRFSRWTEMPSPALPGDRFLVVYGVVRHALRKSRQPASLLPDEVRSYWDRHHSLQVLHSLSFFLIMVLVITLGFGTWHKLGLVDQKRALLRQGRDALEKAVELQALDLQALQQYQRLLPMLQRDVQTLNTLETLAMLQRVRSNQSFWYVLFADRHSYFSAEEPRAVTNLAEKLGPASPRAVREYPHGFIVELCVPEDAEAGPRVAQVVAELAQAPFVRNVDSLPEDRRRMLAATNVLTPGGYFALEIDVVNPLNRPVESPGTEPELEGQP